MASTNRRCQPIEPRKLISAEHDGIGRGVLLDTVEAGRRPDDRALVALIGQLSTRSQEFRTRWAANDVKAHRAGAKLFRHPLIGEVTLPYENLTVDAAGDQVLTVFTPRPGSPEHDAIQLLASWNARTPSPGNVHRSSAGS